MCTLIFNDIFEIIDNFSECERFHFSINLVMLATQTISNPVTLATTALLLCTSKTSKRGEWARMTYKMTNDTASRPISCPFH